MTRLKTARSIIWYSAEIVLSKNVCMIPILIRFLDDFRKRLRNMCLWTSAKCVYKLILQTKVLSRAKA